MRYVRVDDDIKTGASEALAAMELSLSDAVHNLLKREVNDQAFPLELEVSNAQTRTAMQEARAMAQVSITSFDSAARGLRLHQDFSQELGPAFTVRPLRPKPDTRVWLFALHSGHPAARDAPSRPLLGFEFDRLEFRNGVASGHPICHLTYLRLTRFNTSANRMFNCVN